MGFEPQPELTELAASVAGICARVTERQPESRSYRPHLTLARCRKPWPRKTADRLAEQLRKLPRHEFVARRAVLMESKAGCYRVASVFPFAGRGEA